jgi:hypothetical protein
MSMADYQTRYHTVVRPEVSRTLERLCDKYGWDIVLGIFSNDMPDHRREREQQEREERQAKERKRRQRMLDTHRRRQAARV